MRLIDADALLEDYNLKNATKYGNKNAEQQHKSHSTMMMYEIVDMIEDAPTVELNKWIPCSERLPKVRIHDNGEPVCYLTMIKGASRPTELFIDSEGKWHDYCLVYYYSDYRTYNVIAWQPLPQPYKRE